MKFRKEEVLTRIVDYFPIARDLKNTERGHNNRRYMAVLQAKCFLPVDTAENIQN